MKILAKILITALALLAVAYLVPGIAVSEFLVALLVALVLGLLNLIVKPILVVLTLPINILTLGLFLWVINGFLFWLAAKFIEGFSVSGFWTAVLGALIVSVFAWLGEKIFLQDDKED
ncbi:phage holin family protein [Candidatus Wolfebacteria bacterium]|nr:phage holin family protein [Candidatus Wolfebacteria bacterium]